MICLDAFKEAFLHLPEGAKEAEVNAETHNMTSVSLEKGRISNIGSSESTECFIRVSGEKTGYLYTQDIRENPVEALKKAYENSLYSDREIPETINHEAEEMLLSDEEAIRDIDKLKELVFSFYETMQKELSAYPEIEDIMIDLQAETYGQHTVNSYGLDRAAYKPLYILSVGITFADNYFMSDSAAGSPEELNLAGMAEEIRERIRFAALPEAEEFVSGEYEVILSEAAVGQLFMTAWQEFSSAKYKDSACCLKGLLGEKIAGEALTIIDVPIPDQGGFPMLCDAEGTVGKAISVVKNGVFTSLLTNLSDAELLHVEPTGNAGRRPLLFGNIATDIVVTPKNFCIQPGTSSLEEMEAHMGDGILISEYFDLFHSLDISSGNFSVPCYGVLIRDGKEVGNMKGLNLSGNFKHLLESIQEVGARQQLWPMDYLRNYGIGSAALRVGKLTVSGE